MTYSVQRVSRRYPVIGTLRAVLAAIAVAIAIAASSGCTEAEHHSQTPVPSAPGTSPSTTASASTVAPATPASGVSNGRTYSLAMTSIDGSTPDNMGQWSGEIGQLSGGDSAVVEAFNRASQAAARQLIEETRTYYTGRGMNWRLGLHSGVTFRNIAIGQWILDSDYTSSVATVSPRTVVIDSRTAQPIGLADLFTNEQAGLNRLSEQTKIIRTRSNGGKPLPEEGTEPTEANFANWIPTAEGFEFHAAPYQFGVRNPVAMTVPWSALADVLAPHMAALAQS
jgi:hypothetical protein